jgi:CubicO group peptidase (beta-lactamase class C family)
MKPMNSREEKQVHQGEIDVTPQEAGFLPEKLDYLDAFFLDLIAQDKLQCASYLLSRQGHVFAHRSMGKLKYNDDSLAFMPDSIRRVASITKLFAAVSIMQLIEEGKLYLDQPVYTVIEEFDNDAHKEITIFHLLTHSSGLRADPGYFLEPYPKGWWAYVSAAEEGEDVSWIEAILSGPMQSKPGEAWSYSSAGYCMLGEIVSRVSGTPVEQYICQMINGPLGMPHSFFDVPEELHDRVCLTHEWGEKRLKPDKDRAKWPPRVSGGMYSTLPDLWRFGQMLLNLGTLEGTRILGRKTVEAMMRNHLPGGLPAFRWGLKRREIYGLGLALASNKDTCSPGTFHHEGAGACGLYIDPVEELVFAYFVPTTHDWVAESVVGPRTIVWSGLA